MYTCTVYQHESLSQNTDTLGIAPCWTVSKAVSVDLEIVGLPYSESEVPPRHILLFVKLEKDAVRS